MNVCRWVTGEECKLNPKMIATQVSFSDIKCVRLIWNSLQVSIKAIHNIKINEWIDGKVLSIELIAWRLNCLFVCWNGSQLGVSTVFMAFQQSKHFQWLNCRVDFLMSIQMICCVVSDRLQWCAFNEAFLILPCWRRTSTIMCVCFFNQYTAPAQWNPWNLFSYSAYSDQFQSKSVFGFFLRSKSLHTIRMEIVAGFSIWKLVVDVAPSSSCIWMSISF